MITGFPIIWVSKFYTEVELSTLHAEYVALSHSLRNLFMIKYLLKEVFGKFGLD